MTDPLYSLASGRGGASRELLRRLELDVRMRLDGLLHGDYRGLVPGHGSELGEARQYEPGDDVRRIDWNVTARLNETHVRETIADRELETHLLVDLSPSLDFGTTQQEKRDLALSSVAAIGILTSRVGNRLGAVIISASGQQIVPAKQGRLHLLGLLHRIASMPRGSTGSADLGAGLHRIATQARRRGLVVVVSDFLTPPTWQKPLGRLATRHDVLAIEIVDPRELELPDVGVITLTDPETGAQREVATQKAAVRRRYAEAAAEQRAQIAADLRSLGVDHLQLRTDGDWLLDIARYVEARRKAQNAAKRPA